MTVREDVLHLKAPGNWINDPNGFIYYKGKYHLFFQYFPYAPVWGTMHWGHAVSDDLITWKHLGVALFPTKDYDRNGVFSGSALEKDGKLYLYYSAVRYLKEQDENIHQAEGAVETSQSMIISEDGFHFDNWKDKKQIIPVIRDPKIADSADTRDPKVWAVLAKTLYGKLFADRGYISPRLFDMLFDDGIHLVTGIRTNMKNKLMPMWDKIMLRKRCIIETINDMLKNTAQLVHSRHRSVNNFIMNMVAALAAYCFFDNKPQALQGYYIEKTKQLMMF